MSDAFNTDVLLEEDEDIISYARDVMYVYKHISAMSSDLPNPTSAQKGLWEWATNPENKEKFFSTILPKAQDTIIKQKKTEDPDAQIVDERRAIKDLKVLLAEAVEDSQKITA